MSYFDYEVSKDIDAKDFPFYALIMAAMRKADTTNAALLKMAFPATWEELQRRYHAPRGQLEGESR